MKKLCMLTVCCAFFTAHTAHAEDYGFSVSPFTLLGMAFSQNQAVSPRDYIWFIGEVNFFFDSGKEQSIGFIVQPTRYGAHYQNRKYTKDNHSGLLYGFYVDLDYRLLGWKINDEDKLITSFAFLGNPATTEGRLFHTIGATIGVNTGFRLRGERFGGTFYVGAGLPLFYCFGDLPPKDRLFDMYLQAAIYRGLQMGVKIDFYF